MAFYLLFLSSLCLSLPISPLSFKSLWVDFICVILSPYDTQFPSISRIITITFSVTGWLWEWNELTNAEHPVNCKVLLSLTFTKSRNISIIADEREELHRLREQALHVQRCKLPCSPRTFLPSHSNPSSQPWSLFSCLCFPWCPLRPHTQGKQQLLVSKVPVFWT